MEITQFCINFSAMRITIHPSIITINVLITGFERLKWQFCVIELLRSTWLKWPWANSRAPLFTPIVNISILGSITVAEIEVMFILTRDSRDFCCCFSRSAAASPWTKVSPAHYLHRRCRLELSYAFYSLVLTSEDHWVDWFSFREVLLELVRFQSSFSRKYRHLWPTF